MADPHKIGKDRFTLEMAIEKVPELAQYVKKTGKAAGKKKSAIKKPAKEKVSIGKKKSLAKKTKAVKGKSKSKAGNPKMVKVKSGRKPAPKPPEPEIQQANIDDLISGCFRNGRCPYLLPYSWLFVNLLKTES